METERREYFRFNESLMMSYQLEDAETSATDQVALDLIDEFSQMTQQLKTSIARMPGRSVELANSLKLLDAKINLLAQTLLYKDEDNNLTRHQINISAGGLSFGVREEIAVGTIIKLQLVLPPELNTLQVRAKVVNCKKNEDKNSEYPYCLSVKFIDTSDLVQDTIVRHIMRCQADQLRSKNENLSSTP